MYRPLEEYYYGEMPHQAPSSHSGAPGHENGHCPPGPEGPNVHVALGPSQMPLPTVSPNHINHHGQFGLHQMGSAPGAMSSSSSSSPLPRSSPSSFASLPMPQAATAFPPMTAAMQLQSPVNQQHQPPQPPVDPGSSQAGPGTTASRGPGSNQQQLPASPDSTEPNREANNKPRVGYRGKGTVANLASAVLPRFGS